MAGMLPSSVQSMVLNALLAISAFVAPVTGIKCRVDSTLPTASASGTELPSGGGYTTGGQAISSWNNSSSGGNASNVTTLAWTNSSGSAWTVEGIELNDFSANRFLYGAWTGQPITVANGNSLNVAAAAITANPGSW